ncbi:MAG TPA: Trm112 family protein [Actinobacteria bacterium]|nr:Trm112 family protein [Actinomycetota bacterium]
MSDHVVDPELLAIMQCPACGGELAERPEPPALVCTACRLVYAVVDGIPNMLVDEAVPEAEEER